MSYINVKHKCGHHERHALSKWQSQDIEKSREYYAARLCYQCFKDLLKQEENRKINEKKLYLEKLNIEAGYKKLENTDVLIEDFRYNFRDTLKSWSNHKIEIYKDFFNIAINETRSDVFFKMQLNKYSLFDNYISIFFDYPDLKEKILSQITEREKKRNFPELVNIDDTHIDHARAFRDYYYSELEKHLDSNNYSDRISALLLLEETNGNYWLHLKIRYFNENSNIFEYWKGKVNILFKDSAKSQEFIENKIINNIDILEDSINYDENKEVHIIHRFRVIGYSKKRNFYRINIERRNLYSIESWISEKQYKNLYQAFENIRDKYSSHKSYVFGIFENDRFIWAGVHNYERDDRDYLGKLFRVKCPEFEFNPIKKPELEPPKYVEILPELIDEDDTIAASAGSY